MAQSASETDSISASLKVLASDWSGLKAYWAHCNSSVTASCSTPFLWLRKDCEITIKAIQYVSRQCALVLCECGVNVCEYVWNAVDSSLLLKWKEKKRNWWCLPTVQTLSHHGDRLTQPHTRAHTHSFGRRAGVLCGRHGNLGPRSLPPTPPHLSYPPLSFMTLCNLLIWNWSLNMTQSQGWLLEVEDSRRRREGQQEGEQVWGNVEALYRQTGVEEEGSKGGFCLNSVSKIALLAWNRVVTVARAYQES